MKNKLCKIVGRALLVMGLTPLVAMSAPTWHTSNIRWIYPLSDGNFVLTFTADSPACLHTSVPKYYYARIGQNGMSAEGLKQIFAIASLAVSMNKPVQVNFESTSTACAIGGLIVGN
jgi:hypothetical protein